MHGWGGGHTHNKNEIIYPLPRHFQFFQARHGNRKNSPNETLIFIPVHYLTQVIANDGLYSCGFSKADEVFEEKETNTLSGP